MRMLRKWLFIIQGTQRIVRRSNLPLSIIALLIIICFLIYGMDRSDESSCCDPIDVVYTWVNGSDPAFVKSVRNWDTSYDAARFDDKNELRYSLRSLEKYAPWVRHVYIVTNGQIPHWLDLSYERVTVVPHEILAHEPELLPTFSSSAIETFIHRIPDLSKRFLYMNDDIFLGAALYPEDLYTESEGVRVYEAWMVPDCANDCPWTYISDGSCDQHCNIAECQFDGGDCDFLEAIKSDEIMIENYVDEEFTKPKRYKKERKNETARTEIKKFPLRKKFRNMKYNSQSSLNFKEIVRHKNLSTLTTLQRLVENYNSQKKINGLPDLSLIPRMTAKSPFVAHRAANATTRSRKDIYSRSLIYTNILMNIHYGFEVRNVLSHVGFLLDRNIIEDMHQKFRKEIMATASKRFRASDDLQFAFGYFTFLMSETTTVTVGEVFDEFDTDNSKTWSDREVRTFLARMYPLPLDWSAVRFFEKVIKNCSRDLGLSYINKQVYSTLVYERYEDSNVPTITRELVEHCNLLAETLETNFATRSKYKYNVNPKRAIHNNFMMLTSNVSDAVNGFDKIRRNPRKFNCINDDLKPRNSEDNELIRHLLEDFYLSFFPHRSRFELQYEYRNRFTTWHEYQRWRRRKHVTLVVGYIASAIVIIFGIRFLCIYKAKFARRYVERL